MLHLKAVVHIILLSCRQKISKEIGALFVQLWGHQVGEFIKEEHIIILLY